MSDTPLIYGAETEEDDEPTEDLSINGVTFTTSGTIDEDTDTTDSDGDGLSLAETVTLTPNGTPPSVDTLADGASIGITVRLEDGDEIEIFRWGASRLSDGVAPSGLECRLLDGDDTVMANEETALTQDTDSPVASYENTTGSLELIKLQAYNDSGDELGGDEDDGIGAEFGYVVS